MISQEFVRYCKDFQEIKRSCRECCSMEIKTMAEIERNRINEIVNLHSEIEGLLKLSLDKAIRIGELLYEQKANLKHGEYIPWIKTNLPFTERTGQNYMRLYDNREKLKNESVSHLTDGYKLLQRPSIPVKQKGIREQLQELAERNLWLEWEAGGCMVEMNELLTPAAEHTIVGIAGENIVFEIEGKKLTIFELGKKVGDGYKERRYSNNDDFMWWYLDKYIGIGRVRAIWQQIEIELTDSELQRFEGTSDFDDLWKIADQIISERKLADLGNPSFMKAAHELRSGLMDAYGRLCDAYGQLMGTPQPAEREQRCHAKRRALLADGDGRKDNKC